MTGAKMRFTSRESLGGRAHGSERTDGDLAKRLRDAFSSLRGVVAGTKLRDFAMHCYLASPHASDLVNSATTTDSKTMRANMTMLRLMQKSQTSRKYQKTLHQIDDQNGFLPCSNLPE